MIRWLKRLFRKLIGRCPDCGGRIEFDIMAGIYCSECDYENR